VRVVSISPRLSFDEIRKRTNEALRAVYDPKDGLVVITDMVGGTPTNVVLPLVRGLTNTSVISGLNLYMLVTALGQRKTADRAAIVAAMLRNGQRSIEDVGKRFQNHANNARSD
jgi:mannose/fructose-specific phosphotransferase system component IIA